ncbi:chlorite dismutase [Pseudomonas sp. UBA1879]|uniref:chlorite dismutase n=1 Tax=Pseudomonas sp. UBA1879 TaxID=1947305 RepID=UPI0025D00524|nr:chlorite dismutase [Pseudomonas sp. UBA1879]
MTATSQRLFNFIAGEQGPWQIRSNTNLVGAPLPTASRLEVVGSCTAPLQYVSAWQLQGITSNDRYVTRDEKTALTARQPDLGRSSATCAALIALRKHSGWWGLTQDERRTIVEEQSNHIAIGMKYLPAIARRLYHCRDLAHSQPFDFITWFEFAPQDTPAFDELLKSLRRSVEWQFVEREVDIRMVQADAS